MSLVSNIHVIRASIIHFIVLHTFDVKDMGLKFVMLTSVLPGFDVAPQLILSITGAAFAQTGAFELQCAARILAECLRCDEIIKKNSVKRLPHTFGLLAFGFPVLSFTSHTSSRFFPLFHFSQRAVESDACL